MSKIQSAVHHQSITAPTEGDINVSEHINQSTQSLFIAVIQ